MAQDKKALLAVILAVKRGFVSPEEGMNLLEQADEAAATVYDQVPHSQVDELRRDATVLAQDPAEAEKLLAEAGVPPEVQQTLLSLSTGKPADKEEIEATLLSLSPRRATTIIERPKLKTAGTERYQVLREHARGGMGRILVAVDKVVGREVALKELLPFKAGSGSGAPGSGRGTPASNTTAAAARFLREATVTGQLEHPNIVPVYEIGQRDDGSLYYTMKYVKGRTLASRLRAIRTDVDLAAEQKQAERMKLLDAFVDICNAIAFAHSRGVIHRDIKPANIMLGDFGEALVLDWGLARVRGGDNTAVAARIDHEAAPDLTLEGEVMGTPAYMPPEQAAGKLDQVDERSDIYSLGAVLYEIVTGEAPYQGKTAKQVLSSVLSEEPRRVLDVTPEAPPELSALVMRALHRDPDRRFQSARELADEVQAFRDGRMVSTYRYSAFELLSRFVARNRAAVAVTALALLVLVAGGVYAYDNVKRERDAALAAEADAEAQRAIAQDQAREAEQQRGIARERADDAERQKSVAEQKAREAEFERQRADEKAEDARRSETRATRALDQARRNLAQAHMGYAQLAAERNQPGENLLHLAAAHSADPGVVGQDRLVAAIADTPFPRWSTRSYVDLPAGPAVFSADRRLCAAPMHKPPRVLDEFTASADNTALPDVGIWDVATGTLLRRISTEVYQERRLLFSGDGKRLVSLEASGTLRIWDIASGNELAARSAHPWMSTVLLAAAPGKDVFFTAGQDGMLWEWHITDGSAGRMREVKNLAFTALAVAPDGTQAACGAADKVLVWNLQSDEPPRELALTGYVNGLCFAPDGLLVSTSDGEIGLWDLTESKRLRGFTTGSWITPGMELAPDSSLLVVNLSDEGCKAFDYATGEVRWQRGRNEGRVQAASFSPGGETLLLALKGEGFDLVDAEGKSLVARAPDHLLGSLAVEISPDGSLCASGDYGGRLILRRVSDGSTIWSREVSKTNLLRVTFSPDGSRLAVFAANGVLTFVSAADGALLHSNALSGGAFNVKFSPDGRYLAIASNEGPVHLVDPTTANVLKSVTLENQALVLSLAFAPGRDRVWLVDRTMQNWSWDYDTDRPPVLHGQVRLERSQLLYSSTISPDGKLILLALEDGSISAWEPEPFSQRFYIKIGKGPVVNCSFGAGSAFFVCGDGDGMLNYVNARTGEVVLRRRAHRAAVAATAVSPNGRDIVTSSVDGELTAWDAPQFMHSESCKPGYHAASNLVIAPGGTLAAAVTDSGIVRLFEARGGAVVAETEVLPGYAADIAFSPDGEQLAIAHGGSVRLWNLADRSTREVAVHDEALSVDFSPRGRLLVGGAYRGLQVRDPATGELLHQYESRDYLGLLAFPDGRRVLQTGGSVEPRIIDIETGRILATLERGAYFNHANAVSPDGTVVAIMRDRGLIGIHDADTGKRLRTLNVRPDYISSVHFFPDGRRLFYLTESGGAAVVDVSSGQELASTWFGYAYMTRAALAPDGSFALAAASSGEIECWQLLPLFNHLQELAGLDQDTLTAMTQIFSGLKLDNLASVTLPRRTGQMKWLSEDGRPPAFLRGSMPEWVPQLEGAAVERAREFLQADASLRRDRLARQAREWADGFEGFRYREEIDTDLTLRRVALPPRERDDQGRFIGEPQGKIDFAAWLKSRREVAEHRRAEVVQRCVARGAEAEQTGDWRLAAAWYDIAVKLEPARPERLIPYARACLRQGETWNSIWLLSENAERGTPAQRIEMQLLWARSMAWGWEFREMLERFDSAREAGYSAEDWHRYRAEALEIFGAYELAIRECAAALLKVSDPGVRAGLDAVRGRCMAWLKLQQKHADLPLVLVSTVRKDTHAAQAGLQSGDLIIGFNLANDDPFGGYYTDVPSLRAAWERFVSMAGPGVENAVLKVRRDGVELEVSYPRAPLDADLFGLRPRPE